MPANPIKVKVHFRREQKDPSTYNTRTDRQQPVYVHINNEADVSSCPVPIASYKLGKADNNTNEYSKFYSFRNIVEPRDLTGENLQHFVFTTMHVPHYFRGMDPTRSGLNGIFMVPLAGGLVSMMEKIAADVLAPDEVNAVGRQGCATRILMNAVPSQGSEMEKDKQRKLNAFEFNGMRFFPFMLREFTVCYYVADKDGRLDWFVRYKKDFDERFYVSVEERIVYDTTLGIFTTRGADLLTEDELKDQMNGLYRE